MPHILVQNQKRVFVYKGCMYRTVHHCSGNDMKCIMSTFSFEHNVIIRHGKFLQEYQMIIFAIWNVKYNYSVFRLTSVYIMRQTACTVYNPSMVVRCKAFQSISNNSQILNFVFRRGALSHEPLLGL